MNLDDLLFEYFGTTELSVATPEARGAGIERIRVDFGLEQDRGKRFGLWALLYLLDAAPDLEHAFEEADDREAARNFMDLLAASEEGTPPD